MDFLTKKIPDNELKLMYKDYDSLGFGKIYTDYMFTMKWTKEKGWEKGELKKYEPMSFDPASVVIQYSQEVFEGMKAYYSEDGRVLLFRPFDNAKRMYKSAERLCMTPVPEDVFVEAVKELVKIDKRWLPKEKGTSLYIRPTLMGTGVALGVHPSPEYNFCIFITAVGAYFSSGFNTVSLYVEDKLVRAVVGGVGDAKTGGNYAASLLAGLKAEKEGFSQVLWLDAKENKYIEEAGSMNIFFVYGNKLVTPKLTGSILPGITRDSVIKLAAHLGYEVEERNISIDEVVKEIKDKEITEIFGTGTAAVIAPVGGLCYKGETVYAGDNKVGKVTEELYNKLVNIQYGEDEDIFGWIETVDTI
ncbi:branched-chain amino acid aminotransferase [Clostridium sp. AWRP]|uniref:branched-chain amino acid aminotransferase n=1 Tax=Clostridium sp. AWRP TaxID=2212991 RepID=UPI000FD6C654|nr:branched-chain amino acid aminotransferase [Clostridium sp. AWRP]AZV55853.1 branched-chain amino acid aminotransferase [Clostridium sp. AWRP]